MARNDDSYSEVKRLKRLVHRDRRGLAELLDDYLAHADELEEVAVPGQVPEKPPRAA